MKVISPLPWHAQGEIGLALVVDDFETPPHYHEQHVEPEQVPACLRSFAELAEQAQPGMDWETFERKPTYRT